ncbi:hypothetical protein BGZ98_000200 [Dissophora globulifera]|nr:hypothetical protein BGZ98_000200 [Dissophora globulifera]
MVHIHASHSALNVIASSQPWIEKGLSPRRRRRHRHSSSTALLHANPDTDAQTDTDSGLDSDADTVAATVVATAIATPPPTKMTMNAAAISPKVIQAMVQADTTTHHPTSESQRIQDADQDAAIWQVLVDLDRLVRQDHLLLAAEIEDLMVALESHCHQLGVDPVNDILRRRERVERLVSRIITIAENICEPPEPYLQSAMPPMSRARVLQLERTYQTLEKEWIERLQRFQSMVGMLRVRWDQCGYFPVDDYDNALYKLFELADPQDPTLEISQIEAPLCLSKACLTSLSTKLADLDQNYYTRQARIKAMEHILGSIYQDLGTAEENKVIFRNEATVKYAAELGRELKAFQIELTARKVYQSGERWEALTAVWNSCLVGEQERNAFRSAIEQSDVPYVEKLDRIQSRIESCRVRFSKCGSVYKLMMTRSNHIERMVTFESAARDPKRLFQSSFQLVEEEKFRRRAYPTLLKLESTLIEAIEAFEKEHEERFVYEGVPYLETLQSETDKRHVNETVFAKFTPLIAAPTRSQTIQIMGRPISPISTPQISTPSLRPSTSLRNSMPPVRPLDTSRRSHIHPELAQASIALCGTLSSREALSDRNKDSQDHGAATPLKPHPVSHRRDISGTSMVSASSGHLLKSKSSMSSLSVTSGSASGSASAANSPLAETNLNGGSYFESAPPSSLSCAPTAVSHASTNFPTSELKSQPAERLSLPSSGSKSLVGLSKTSTLRLQSGSARRMGS